MSLQKTEKQLDRRANYIADKWIRTIGIGLGLGFAVAVAAIVKLVGW